MTKIMPTNEIMGAFLANAKGSESELYADPKSFLYSNYNVETDADVNLVENTASQVNLTLPYYSVVDTVTASKETDEVINDVAGGIEIITLLIVLTTSSVIAGAAIAGGAAGVATGVAADKK